MDDYLAKPFGQDALIAAIARWTGGSPGGLAMSASGATGEGPLDPLVMEDLRAMGAAFLGDSVRAFLEHAPGRIAAARAALARGDARELRRAVHSLRGSAAILGARTVTQCCARIEERLEHGDRQVAPLLAAVEAELEQARSALNAEVQALRGEPEC
jgi:HPt (histidine-containing phosphotransfer) domain-containing protein